MTDLNNPETIMKCPRCSKPFKRGLITEVVMRLRKEFPTWKPSSMIDLAKDEVHKAHG